ncbi:MAG: (2Fe-2S) ferredoxin domain-containing protein [Leptolyngbya sp.]|nr:(2Fe-2S) ferredoxin domain-containing protein [Leptolyngbya sp.]
MTPSFPDPPLFRDSTNHRQRWLVQVCQHRSCLRQQGAAVLAAFQAYRPTCWSPPAGVWGSSNSQYA